MKYYKNTSQPMSPVILICKQVDHDTQMLSDADDDLPQPESQCTASIQSNDKEIKEQLFFERKLNSIGKAKVKANKSRKSVSAKVHPESQN